MPTPPGTPNDATTVLNPGSGGDTMNESVITQVSGKVAKSERLVPTTDQGQLYSQTGTTSKTAGSASAVELIVPNALRLGLTIFNNSTATLYVGASNAVTNDNFIVAILPGGYWELPTSGSFLYVGALWGIWASATGDAQVTEFT